LKQLSQLVMRGLDPRIHLLRSTMDCRAFRREDGASRLLSGNDAKRAA
jgi:hypothetical protein